MKKIIRFVFLLFTISFTTNVFAGIRLPAVISSNMVLQQQSQAALWGWADPNEKIVITSSWKNSLDSLTAPSDGRWKIKISTPVAGGPYTITLKGRNTIVLENVLIGEVWVCSGQSNMEMSNTQQMMDEMPNSANDNIRVFDISRASADYPQDNCDAKWRVCNAESLRGFTAVGYFFGKKLQKDLNVPIGLIESTWGGTPVEVWTPAPVIEMDATMKEAAGKLSETLWGPHKAGVLYNGMIAPIINYGIAGAIWYQGEGNTSIPFSYEKTFTSMIGSWRKGFEKEFPFYYVQIAPYIYGRKYEGALIMEQQAKTLSYPNTGLVVVTDLVDNIKDIHPKNKYDVGIRLANLALGQTYKQNIPVYNSPMYKSMEVNKGKVTLFFTNAPNGFMVKGTEKPTEFLIAGSDKNFLPADVKIEKDRIILSNKQITDPVAVRFSFSNTGMSNVFSKEGLPLAPFRTDNWEIIPGKE
ncbi:MAG: sialate O-acetylesterase [Chitinophagaceae bacterium]